MTNATAQKPVPQPKIDYQQLDEMALLRAVIGRDERAWREFVRRYDTLIRAQIGKTLYMRVGRHSANDMTDDIASEVYIAILDHNMSRLRCYDPTKGARLTSWLCLISSQSADRHLRGTRRRNKAHSRAARDGLRELSDIDPNRGGRWLGREREA